MSLTVRPITAAEHLAFIEKQPSVSFLQTPSWARVKTEWRSESIGWFDSTSGGALVGAALVLHRPVPKLERYTLAYLPEGPSIDWSGELAPWLEPLATYLKKNRAFGIRIGPPVTTAIWSAGQVKDGIADETVQRLNQLTPSHRDATGARVVSQLRAAGWKPQSPEDGFGAGQPQYNFVVPLAHEDGTPKTEDEVLKGMNQLWRRNIKKSAKMGVEVAVATPAKPAGGEFDADLSAFHELYVHTAERDHFTPRRRDYFKTMFAAMSAEDPERIKLFIARHEGDVVAATIMVRVGQYAWYSYGASSTEKRDVRGSNALQWAMIQDAMAAGATSYDLRGITPTLSTDDSHVGLIQFKVGTGGQAVEYAGEWDLPLNKPIYTAFDLYMKRR